MGSGYSIGSNIDINKLIPQHQNSYRFPIDSPSTSPVSDLLRLIGFGLGQAQDVVGEVEGLHLFVQDALDHHGTMG